MTGQESKPSAGTRAAAEFGETLERIGKLFQTSAGMGAVLATVNFSANLTGYIGAKCIPPNPHTSAPPPTVVFTRLGSLLSDSRKTLRLAALLPLCLRFRSLRASKQTNSTVRRLLLARGGAYIVFQVLENASHLHAKGILPQSVINRYGGLPRVVRWTCRVWCFALLLDLLRLLVEIPGDPTQLQVVSKEKGNGQHRRWWTEFRTVMCWLPVSVNGSFYPRGIKWINPGIIALLSLLATWGSLQAQWQLTSSTRDVQKRP